MRAVDTNVLVRLITRDDLRQARSADRFVEKGAWVSVLALAEATWVLGTVYEFSAADLATALQMLLNHKDLTLQDPDVVAAAPCAQGWTFAARHVRSCAWKDRGSTKAVRRSKPHRHAETMLV